MLQRIVDHFLAVIKESVKTFTYESLNNIVRLINGISALLLALLPGKATMLEGIQGWELRPKFRGPRLPRWMENGVSSFNEFLHELSVDSDTSSTEDYASGEEDNDLNIAPASPSSQVSLISRASSFRRRDRHIMHFMKCLFYLVLWPVTFMLSMPLLIYHKIYKREGYPSSQDNLNNKQLSDSHHAKMSSQIKAQIVHRATDRRRGVVEDLQLASEIFIESMFNNFHKAAHFVLSPSKIFQVLFGWLSSRGPSREDGFDDNVNVAIPTATLADADPTPTERSRSFHHSLNTDARTGQDVISELGYPYEAIRVVTSDGYVLLLERIPRRESRKVIFLQHGVFDSSMGWVSNGVVGSPAFAAYDQGYDVFLGNLRGLASREHVNKNISPRMYWRYSINEHGTQDIPAMIEKIHQIKTSELNVAREIDSEDAVQEQPYKLCAVCHSLGGAAILIYIITRRIEEKPHRLCRLILLSPAGFHDDSSIVFTIMEYSLLLFGPLLARIMPGIYIPTRFFRMLVNKLARDFQNYPALGGLVQTLMGYVVGGDSSNWVGVLGLPHYNMYDMPGVSLRVGFHLAQLKRTGKFTMYDFGSPAANMEAYGSPEPFDLGQHYHLIDIPVDLVAGKKDKVIRRSMVRKHYKLMRRAGVEATYNEFEYAHLDFTFSHREELLAYVMSRLLLVMPSHKPQDIKSSVRLRRTSKSRPENEANEE